MGIRFAPLLAATGGVLLVAAVLALVLHAHRDSSNQVGIAVIGAVILVQVGIVGLHRGGPGSRGRPGRAAPALGIGGPLAAVLGAAIIGMGGPWVAGSILVAVGLLAVLAGWMATAISLLAAGRVPARGPVTLLWGTVALLLVEPWNLRVLFALPAGVAWILIGWAAWRAAERVGTEAQPGVQPRPGRRLQAAAIVGLAIILATGVLAEIGRLGGRPTGTPGFARADGGPLPVVIDTDSLPDDWIAITYLLARTDVAVRAITVSGSSVLGCEEGMRQVLRLLALAKVNGVPVACGRLTSAAANHWFPAAWRPGVQALVTNVPLPEPVDTAESAPAVDVLRAAISGSARPVVLVALGPLTNVADLLATRPNLGLNIAGIVVMGGAVDVPGNVGDDTEFAEWNVFVDPAAANDVLRSGAPVTLVALDASGDVPVRTGFVERLRARASTPALQYVANLLLAQDEFVRSGDYFFWDPLAAAVATDGRLAGFLDRRLGVEVGPGPASGRVVDVADGGPVRLAVSADAGAFEDALLGTLAGSPAR